MKTSTHKKMLAAVAAAELETNTEREAAYTEITDCEQKILAVEERFKELRNDHDQMEKMIVSHERARIKNAKERIEQLTDVEPPTV